MREFTVSCSKCGNRTVFKYPTRATINCSFCGSSVGQISFPEDVEDNSIIFQCLKCDDHFVIRAEVPSLLQCPSIRCGWVVLATVKTITLSNILHNEVDGPEIVVTNPRIVPPPIVENYKVTSRIAIPYYSGGPRIQRAIESWIYPEVVFVLTDKGIIPPGHGVCNQLFTEKNSYSEGLSAKTKPYLIDILSQMLKLYPKDEYYGYFNSDVILPLGTPIKNLFPQKGKNIVFHHRREFEGLPETPINKLEEKYQTYCGKDGFICDRKTAQNIVDKVEDMILGAATWDNGLAVWAIKEYGADKVDLRYGEIWHQLHEQEWGYDDKETIFNRKQWDKMGLGDPIRNSVNWYKVGESSTESPKVKKLGIIQPGRIGDIIIVLPIAKWYYDLGYKIIWPVASEYMDLFEYVNYVCAIDIGPGLQNSYSRSKAVLSTDKLDFELDLGIGFGRDESDWKKSGLSFDEWKYREAGVPFEERFNLFIHRKYQKELDLEKKLDLEQIAHLEKKLVFSLTHSVGSKGKVNFGIPNSIEIEPIPGFTIFDWIGLIERCNEIYCVDSCVAHLVNQMGLAKGRRHFRPLSDYLGRPRKMAVPQIDWGKDKKDSFVRIGLCKSTSKTCLDLDDKTGGGAFPPIHFFTIVLNGISFIKYHIDMMKSLPFDWHWHIIEGVADLNHDSQWSRKLGGRVDKSFHMLGLSNDGTTEYLNQLSHTYPENVSLYRKRNGKFWDGKVEMINAPIESLPDYCLLWQIDVDEYWDKENISKMVKLFQDKPDKMAAYVPSHFFVGPRKFVTSQNTWATLPDDSFRVFQFFKGMHWKMHEPPMLIDGNGKDWGRCSYLSRNEVLKAGIFFQHFAYVVPEQLKFKEIYYGYTGALKFWKRLQVSTEDKLDPSRYLPWARPGAIVETWDESVHGPLLFKGGLRHVIDVSRCRV